MGIWICQASTLSLFGPSVGIFVVVLVYILLEKAKLDNLRYPRMFLT